LPSLLTDPMTDLQTSTTQADPDVHFVTDSRASTAASLADSLMQEIISGHLKAGERLPETRLAKRMGASRNSVREAIRLLEQSRLVHYEMHRGSVVSKPNVADLDDLYRTRLHLETTALNEPPAEKDLQALHNAFESLVAATKSHDSKLIVGADLEFHQAIVDLLDSERISAFFAVLRKELVFYLSVLSHEDQEFLYPEGPIIRSHRAIYEAVATGNLNLAIGLITEHIDDNHQRLRDILLRDADAQ
jgi:DNA-binding GntR family transcriptional regulator